MTGVLRDVHDREFDAVGLLARTKVRSTGYRRFVWLRRRKPGPTELVEQLKRCHRCGAGVGAYDRACPSCGRSLVEEKTAILRALRDRGAMTSGAFDAAVETLEGAAEGPIASGRPAVRKQVGELQLWDLHEFPVWEFALDEEGLDGQDEETIRPRPDLARVDPRAGMFVVRAEFVAADGTAFEGFVSPDEQRHVAYVQPTIVADERHVRFWFGIVAPAPAVLEASYRILGKTPPELFPVRYRSLVDTTDGYVAGTLDGFMHYAGGSTSEIVSVT